jgi:hypothetical protein
MTFLHPAFIIGTLTYVCALVAVTIIGLHAGL